MKKLVSHRISQVGMIVALLNGWKLFSVGSVAQPFLDEDDCRVRCRTTTTAAPLSHRIS